MTINSNNGLNGILSNFKSSEQYKKALESESSTNVSKESYKFKDDEPSRYNFLTVNGWFDNSIIMKDENLNAAFRDFISKMNDEEYTMSLISISTDFLPQLVQNENGVVENGPSLKNPNKELATISTIINYYENKITEVIENASKWGGDPTERLDMLNGFLNFFKNYESKEQENQYLALAKAKY